MAGQVLQFGGSLLAILALVAFTHFLGFSRVVRLDSKGEAAELLRLAAGGFEPERVFLDRDGRGALAQDNGGRLAVLKAHGGQFVTRILGPDTHVTVGEDNLVIAHPALGSRPLVLRFDNRPESWVIALSDASRS